MAMDVDKQCHYWRLGAINAMETAELLIQNGRYDFGLFFLTYAIR